MDRKLVKRRGEYRWLIKRTGKMRVEGMIFASEKLIAQMDDKVVQQRILKLHPAIDHIIK